ncbi:23S rRNA (adenine(2030)-N(6))-methyltransferase RlmJ [Pelagibacteraceae bacterium]|nr:23S rRNA (adenine(2030)-N(6))-methyltransferase RlmJ [Pelagibacteraceae bacterium]
MLSYKHGYHAGNQADVFKHICLIQAYKILKNHYNSINYIDTHAGSGDYDFKSDYMEKNKEYQNGINKLENYKYENQSIKFYLKVIRNINNSKKLSFYPGSPSIMSYLSDNNDKLSFYELHNNEFLLLRKKLSKQINSKVFNKDGFEFTNQKINSNEKTLVLIDPSYEIKDDFDKVVNTLRILDIAHSNLTALIWYPVLNIVNNDLFIENIRKLGSNRITRIELPLKKYNEEIGMKGSGIILFDGSKFLIDNLKKCVKELFEIFKDANCNIRPKIQKI